MLCLKYHLDKNNVFSSFNDKFDVYVKKDMLDDDMPSLLLDADAHNVTDKYDYETWEYIILPFLKYSVSHFQLTLYPHTYSSLLQFDPFV